MKKRKLSNIFIGILLLINLMIWPLLLKEMGVIDGFGGESADELAEKEDSTFDIQKIIDKYTKSSGSASTEKKEDQSDEKTIESSNSSETFEVIDIR
jgi:hypothetical protein